MDRASLPMDERGYLAQALLDRLSAEGIAHRVLGEAAAWASAADDPAAQLEIVVAPAVLADVPRLMARFSRDFDLRLVQLVRSQGAWHCVLAWSDEVGRPRFISATVHSDWYVGPRRLLRASELLRGTPEIVFIHGLLGAVEDLALEPRREAWLSRLWHESPRAAMQSIARFWRRGTDIRLVAQAAKHGEWSRVHAALPHLRRAMHRAVLPRVGAGLRWLAMLARRALQSEGAVIAFTGPEGCGREELMHAVSRDLAPAFPGGLTTIAQGFDDEHAGVDVHIVFDQAQYASQFDDAVLVDSSKPLSAAVPEVERALLRWLECRVERRFPGAVVGENPAAARLLQFACRERVPLLGALMRTLLNCGIHCRIRSPILMPYPYGIVIDRAAVIGSRVTVMHQVTIGCKRPDDPGAPVIEDNVFLGAGAKVLGAIRIGRGATIGANAVVTRDVPSHCTVVGANRILGYADPVVAQRLENNESVVNM